MSFEMKYDRDGNPIKSATPPVVEEPVQEITTELVQESIESAPEEPQETIQEQEVPVEEVKPVKAKPTPQESFKQLKEAKEREERERLRLEREHNDLMRKYRELEAKNQPQQKEQVADEDYNININPDDLVEGKHLSQVDKKIKSLEKQLKQYEQQTTLNTIQSRLKSQYPDFDSVVSNQNIETLKAQYPELAQTLNASTDLYATAVSAYTMIKKFGIAQTPEQIEDIKRINNNAAKPRPLTSISPQQGETPLSRVNAFANGLTEELKEQLRKEMFTARNNM